MRFASRLFPLMTAAVVLSAAPPAGAVPHGGPLVAARPAIVGTVAVGRRLSAVPGTWSGAGDLRYRYQWYRCDAAGARCNAINGATSLTYMLVGRDTAKTIALTVWA